MKKNKTEVILILDRSGSMSSIKNDIEGGLKTFVEKQKNELGECSVSLFQFDAEYESVFENQDIKSVPNITVNPRGMTALFDAIGKTINSVGERLSKTLEDDRPELVIVNVITDGFENSSKEFTKDQIKKLIKHQTDKYNWKFIFLGANQDAVLSGTDYGFVAGSSLTYGTSSNAIKGTFDVLCSGISCMRSMVEKTAASGAFYSFSDEDRKIATLS